MENQETENEPYEDPAPAIYSKWAIAGFSIFLSPIAGAILLMLNLRSIGYKREGTGIVLFTIAYQIIAAIVLSRFINIATIHNTKDLLANKQFAIYSFVSGIIAACILTEYFFNKYFGGNDYETKSIWRPLLITILILLCVNILFGI